MRRPVLDDNALSDLQGSVLTRLTTATLLLSTTDYQSAYVVPHGKIMIPVMLIFRFGAGSVDDMDGNVVCGINEGSAKEFLLDGLQALVTSDRALLMDLCQDAVAESPTVGDHVAIVGHAGDSLDLQYDGSAVPGASLKVDVLGYLMDA